MEKTKKNLAIVFDIGGVLIDWNPRYLYKNLFNGDSVEMEFFLENVCSPDWNKQLDEGRPFQDAIEERIQLFPKYESFIRAYHTHWEEMVSGAINETVEVLKDLKDSGYFLCALSNWSAETFPLMKKRFEFLDWFEIIILSGEVGIVKPDPVIYHILLEKIKRNANECLFIDDAPENIETANSLGFKTIHFHSAGQLRIQLQDMKMVF